VVECGQGVQTVNADALIRSDVVLVHIFESGLSPEADVEFVQKMLVAEIDQPPDLLSFPIHRGTGEDSITSNVRRLKSLLALHASEASHLVFITHGIGSLVIKALLLEAMKEAVASDDTDQADYRNISFRTRKIVCAGTALAFQKAPRFLKSIGKIFSNSAQDIDARVFQRRFEIDRSLSSLLRAFADTGWPYPQLDELLLDDEFSRETSGAEDSLRGMYGEFCELVTIDDLSAWPRDWATIYRQASVRTHVRREIQALLRALRLPLTGKVVTTFFDRPELVGLISETKDDDQEDSERATSGSSGTQKTVFAEVYRQVVRRPGRFHENCSIVISGQAGLGKSTILRRLAQSSAFNFYRRPTPKTPAPIFINMPTVSIESLSIGGVGGDEFLAQLIVDKIVEVIAPNFVERLNGDSHSLEGLQRALARQATLLIIDGVDEFLINAPDIRFVHFRMAVEKLLDLFSEVDFNLVLGIRNSVRNFAQLASLPDKVFMLSRLSTEQAYRHFGETSKWIGTIQRADLRVAFLTPLILSAFSESNVRIHSRISTISGLWELALRSILSKSGISKISNSRGGVTSRDQWIVALSIAAAAFHTTLRYEFSISELRETIAMMRKRWEKFSNEHRDILAPDTDLAIGFDLLGHERTLKAMIERTVFTITPQNTVQFNHRQWRDYLTARYTATCIELGNVDEFGEMAFNVEIYRSAGELLSSQAINEELISRAIQRTLETKNEFIIGNLGALIGNAAAPLTRPAIIRLFQLMPDYTPLIQTIIVGSVGRRGLETSDPSSIDIRKGIQPTLRLFGAQAEGKRFNRLVESVSWCFLKAYHKRFNEPPPPENFRPFSFDGHGSDDARAVVCLEQDDLWTYDNKFASVQNTFAMIQETVLADQVTRPISVVHYLACILAARTAGAQIPEVTEELGAVLKSGSDFEAAYRDFEDVPEVYDLYRLCQTEYRRFGGE
jgi:hypothetical protein